MNSELLEEGEAAFAILSSQYQLKKQKSEALCVEWKWYSSACFDVRPLYFEHHGWPRGRRIAKAPAAFRGHVENGFAKTGHVVVERRYNEFGFYESFYTWDENRVEVAHFDYYTDKQAINMLIVELRQGRAQHSHMSAIHGSTQEHYHWRNGLVRSIDVEHARRENGVLLPPTPLHEAVAAYDESGRLQRVCLNWPAAPPRRHEPAEELMYERRGKKIYRPRV